MNYLFASSLFLLISTTILAQQDFGDRIGAALDELATRLETNFEMIAERIERETERDQFYVRIKSPAFPQVISGCIFEDALTIEGIPIIIESGDSRASMDHLEVQVNDRPFIGVYIRDISEEKARKLGFDNHYGIYVIGIVPGSAAETAGLQLFDYLFGVDQFRVGAEQNIGDILRRYNVGDEATLHLIRKEKKTTLKIKLGTYVKAEPPKPTNDCEDPFLGVLEMEEPLPEGIVGVRVSPTPGSTAQDIGLASGDVILKINGYKIVDWDDLSTAINALKPGQEISVTYSHKGKVQTAGRPIKSLAETKNCKNCKCGDQFNIVLGERKAPDIALKFRERGVEKSSKNREISRMNIAVADAESADMDFLRSRALIPSENTTTLDLTDLSVEADGTTGQFSISFKVAGRGNLTVTVFEASGRAVFEAEYIDYTGDFSEQVDLAQSIPSDFLVVVRMGNALAVKKLTVK